MAVERQSIVSVYGLLGKKLGHSWSPSFFARKFKQDNIEAEYRLFETNDIEGFIKSLGSLADIRGFNVTIPYKTDIINYLDFVEHTAAAIGAVNVVKCIHLPHDGLQLYGYNTDWKGFITALKNCCTVADIRGAIVLGTGGASKAVEAGLKTEGIKTLFVSRSHKSDNIIGYEDITPQILRDYNLVVNSTPAGMWPDVNECPALPYHLLNSDNICFDLTYNPSVTRFMRESQAQGAKIIGGLEMLENQAELAWSIWNS